MGSVAQVEELERELKRRLSDATITVDPPEVAGGSWWVDIERNGKVATVEWRPTGEFGVSSPGSGYGEGPEYIVTTVDAAADHIAQILRRAFEYEPSPL